MIASELKNRFSEILIPYKQAKNVMAIDVKEGLTDKPKNLPCIYFYDERGSLLFEDICRLPEYYLTRTEAEILQSCADDIASLFPEYTSVVELGSGSAIKTRYLLEAFLRAHGQAFYNPIDISHSILRESSLRLLEKYSDLEITAIAATYEEGLRRMNKLTAQSKLILWLGSSIGNFQRTDALFFVRKLRDTMHQDDRLLMGVDLLKERAVIEKAYNDKQGVTAAFNLNLLNRINRELHADFDLKQFAHRAPFNEESGRIEMYLHSLQKQTVYIDDLELKVPFEAGETILTEFSHKYSLQEIDALAEQAGFSVEQQWLDQKEWFSLNMLAPA